MKSRLFFLVMLFSLCAQAQLTQTIRGTVKDKESKFPLMGVNIIVKYYNDSSSFIGTVSDLDGNFKIENVKVGRIKMVFKYIGFKPVDLDNLLLNSAKELILTIDMEESAVQVNEVQITATRAGDPLNEMATVSSRAFTIAETDRYAGSRGDPARMASNFAGVQGADDSRNDIIIRGNSPQSVLWRIEGVDIPNPNHFAIAGTAGGPVSIINNKTLANSDFYTSAFPAEFGNTVAGAFDLRLRNGNNRKFEKTAQLGFLGTDLTLEGPLKKGSNSSFLVTYRYSTLAMFSKLGINIGTDATPNYQDGFFKLNFDLKKKGYLSFWGLGGSSNIDIKISDQIVPNRNLYGDNDRDQNFGTSMAISGLTYSKPINKSTFIKNTFAVSTENQKANHNLIFRHLEFDGNRNDSIFKVDSLVPMLDYKFKQNKISNSFYVNHKINAAQTFKAGIITDLILWNMLDSVRDINVASPNYFSWSTRWNTATSAFLIQPYAMWKYKYLEKITVTAGLHAQYFTLSKSASWVEPRVGIRVDLPHRSNWTAGAGLHSQTQPYYTYFYGKDENSDGKIDLYNKNMGFTKSLHTVTGYEKMIGKFMRFKTEAYYQTLWNVPVSVAKSSFSLVNTGSGFSRFFPDSLQNTGTATNYGIEFTFEKFYSNNYLFLFTASFFDSKYTGSDGIQRNTDFNGKYAMNALLTREFKIGKASVLGLGSKFTMAGGRWYGPADSVLSNQQREVVYVDALRNTLQFKDYMRFDLRVEYKISRPKVSHEIAIDFVNLFGIKNVLKLSYAPDDPTATNGIRQEYQLGFLPLFYYKIDF